MLLIDHLKELREIAETVSGHEGVEVLVAIRSDGLYFWVRLPLNMDDLNKPIGVGGSVEEASIDFRDLHEDHKSAKIESARKVLEDG